MKSLGIQRNKPSPGSSHCPDAKVFKPARRPTYRASANWNSGKTINGGFFHLKVCGLEQFEPGNSRNHGTVFAKIFELVRRRQSLPRGCFSALRLGRAPTVGSISNRPCLAHAWRQPLAGAERIFSNDAFNLSLALWIRECLFFR